MSTRQLIPGLAVAALSLAAVPSYVVQTFAGSDFIGDGGPAAKALLAAVQSVAADALGNYYLADTDAHRIRRISPSGIITTFAGTGKPGFSGDGGPAALAQLNLPYGVAADLAGNIYVADFGNHCIRKISPNGGIITTVAGLIPGTQMAGPRNLAVDTGGNVYISDFIASRVFRLTPQGAFTAYAGGTAALALGDNGPATAAILNCCVILSRPVLERRATTLYIFLNPVPIMNMKRKLPHSENQIPLLISMPVKRRLPPCSISALIW